MKIQVIVNDLDIDNKFMIESGHVPRISEYIDRQNHRYIVKEVINVTDEVSGCEITDIILHVDKWY